MPVAPAVSAPAMTNCARSPAFSWHGRAASSPLFDDPTDNTVAAQVIGTGDSTAAVFQLVRNMGGFAEPMTAPILVSAIYFNGVHQDPAGYTVDAETGQVTFTAAPPIGQIVTADFTYRFRVRFADDSAEFENFMYQLWQLKQIKLQSVLR